MQMKKINSKQNLILRNEIVRLLQDSYINRKDAMIAMPDKPNSKIGMSWIDPALIYFMENSNRKIGPMETSMILKQAAVMAGMQSGINASNIESSVATPFSRDSFDPRESLWKSKDFKNIYPSEIVIKYNKSTLRIQTGTLFLILYIFISE